MFAEGVLIQITSTLGSFCKWEILAIKKMVQQQAAAVRRQIWLNFFVSRQCDIPSAKGLR